MSIINNFKDYIDSINEGLVKTYPGDVVFNDILKSLKTMSLNVNGDFVDDKISIIINDFNLIQLNKIGHLFDHLLTFVVNRGGWFPSTMIIKNVYGVIKESKYSYDEIVRSHESHEIVTIVFESKFESSIDNIPNKLYHLTIKEHCKKISKSGLSPRSKSKLSSHLDRIYVCNTIEDCKSLIPKMMFFYTGEKDDNVYKLGKKLFNKDITPIIYEIDNSGGFITKLYNDVNYYGYGYYIMDNITPDKLSVVFTL